MSDPQPDPADAAPGVSVVMPVFNGTAFLDRAIQSLYRQTFTGWELLAVDDGSTDGSYDLLCDHARRDGRVRALRLPRNAGQSAARNHALGHARGRAIAYLDCDDEYWPRYLGMVHRWIAKADVLVFSYDIVTPDPTRPNGVRVKTWAPARVHAALGQRNIATPLGVAHRLELVGRVGRFDESRSFQEDWDLWRRFAAAGATFLFLPAKSGRYHVRPGSQARTRRTPAALPPAAPGVPPVLPAPPDPDSPRVLFAAYHSYFDPVSGAALATRDLLELLAARGWACGACTGPRLDANPAGRPFHELLADHGIVPQVVPREADGVRFTLTHFVQNGVTATVYRPDGPAPANPPDRSQGGVFLRLLADVMDRFRPDAILTYGGHWLQRELLALARGRGVPTVMCLHNLQYGASHWLRSADAVLVPSRFARDYYRRSVGVTAAAIPCPWDWSRVVAADPEPRYLTFVNPQPAKGAAVFAAIARALATRRPDIPLLVVAGRGSAGALTRFGVRPGRGNVRAVAGTPHPRDIYRVSRAVVVPSLVQETFGRVAAEATCNGLPVLATRRGALPETLAGAGLLFDPPAGCTPESAVPPSPADVAGWVDAVERLWDDRAFYEEHRRRCLAAAEQWRPDRLFERFEAFFTGLLAGARRQVSRAAT